MIVARPLRSVLYVPGSNDRALDKAGGLPVDGVILDLEDAVAPEAKERARDSVRRAVAALRGHSMLVAVRVNASGTTWHEDDLRLVAELGPDAVVVPKVSGPTVLREVASVLDRASAAGPTRVWAMIETPSGVLAAADIAGATPRLSALVAGTNDLVVELGARPGPGREPVLAALSLMVLAARAAGVAALDGVFNDIADRAGFERECRQGRDLGFDGKTLIHPTQIDACNRIHTPSPAEVAAARAVVEAFDAAAADGRGVTVLDGKMIEQLHVTQALRTIAAGAQPG